jgi:formate dehydrogenase (coenzyme F420) beta subunit
MTEFSKLEFKKGEMNAAICGLLSKLIERDVVTAILAPARQPSGGVMPTLITSPKAAKRADPLAPVVPLNAAKVASSLTANPSDKPTALVMRSCEVRALVELVKLKQANLDDVLMIGVDCLGRYENGDFLKLTEAGKTTETFLEAAQSGRTAEKDIDISDACTICESPVPDNVDIRLGVLGASPDSLIVEWVTDKGRAARDKLEIAACDAPAKRAEAVEKLTQKRTEARDKKLAAFRDAASSFEKLEQHLSGCINCYNCRVACPVCYCKECVFVTDTFRHDGEQYLGWATKTGALKMPTDTLFYHLVRLTHMSTLCVGCGQCSSACPNDIELMPLFRATAEKTQARFDYLAGRSLEEKQPLAVFYDNELQEVTGQVK